MSIQLHQMMKLFLILLLQGFISQSIAQNWVNDQHDYGYEGDYEGTLIRNSLEGRIKQITSYSPLSDTLIHQNHILEYDKQGRVVAYNIQDYVDIRFEYYIDSVLIHHTDIYSEYNSFREEDALVFSEKVKLTESILKEPMPDSIVKNSNGQVELYSDRACTTFTSYYSDGRKKCDSVPAGGNSLEHTICYTYFSDKVVASYMEYDGRGMTLYDVVYTLDKLKNWIRRELIDESGERKLLEWREIVYYE